MSAEAEQASAFRFIKNAESMLVAVTLAMILWMGTTIYQNSLTLTRMTTQIETLVDRQELANQTNATILDQTQARVLAAVTQLDERMQTIWPRLREMKERVQRLESISGDARAQTSWAY